MKPITKQEIQAIIDSGVTKNFIEKKLGMGQGSIGKFLTGKLNSLPDKYAVGIRKIGKEIANTNENLIKVSTEVLNIMDKREIPVNIGDDEAFNKIQGILKDNPEKNTGDWFLNPDSLDKTDIEPELKYQVKPDIEVEWPSVPKVEVIKEQVNNIIKRPKINKDLLP